MHDIISASEFSALQKSESATTESHYNTSMIHILKKIDSALDKLEKLGKSPNKVFPTLIRDLAIISSDITYSRADTSKRAKRAIALLEKWGCEAELVKAVNFFYFFDKIASVSECFADMVCCLTNVAKDESAIHLLAQIKQDIDGDTGCFSEIGFKHFECALGTVSFEKAKQTWNLGKTANLITISLTKNDFEELKEKGSIQRGNFHVLIKNKRARFYTLEGQSVRTALHNIFEKMPNELQGKIAIVGMDTKTLSLPPSTHVSQHRIGSRLPPGVV